MAPVRLWMSSSITVVVPKTGVTFPSRISPDGGAIPSERSPKRIFSPSLPTTHGGAQDPNPAEASEEPGYDTTTAGRRLDHSNPIVEAEIKSVLKDYLCGSLGFTGFRYDMASGFPARHVGLYNDYARPILSIGEFCAKNRCNSPSGSTALREGLRHPMRASISAGGRALHSTLPCAKLWDALSRDDFSALRTAEDQMPGIAGLCPDAAVTFLENHDTEPVRQNGKAFPTEKILAGYAYLLTHPGKPTTVFWSHFFDYGLDQFRQSYQGVISQLIVIRRRSGINCA